jgi:cell wall assembly regulator SMI1
MAGADLIHKDGGPAADGALEAAEESLGAALPDDYRAFLAEHDGVRLDDNRMDGDHTPSGGADSLFAAKDLRRIEDGMVAIGEAGGGDKIALALDSGRVFQWEHETDDATELAPSFRAWFDALVPLTDDDLPDVVVHSAGVKRGFLRRMRRQGRL